MPSRKVSFALAARAAVTQLAEAAERIGELHRMFVASGYDSGGSDEIVDGDLVSHDITAADLASVATFAVQLDKFLTNQVPTQFDYATAIDKFRSMD